MLNYCCLFSITHIQLNSSEPWLDIEEEMLVGGLHPWRNYSFEVGYPSPVGLGAVWANCPTTHCYTLQGSKHCTHDLYPSTLSPPSHAYMYTSLIHDLILPLQCV